MKIHTSNFEIIIMVRCDIDEKYHPCLSVTSCLLILGGSMTVCLWITGVPYHMEDGVATLDNLKIQLQCVTCNLCAENQDLECTEENDCENIRIKCASRGWRIAKQSSRVTLPRRCQQSNAITNFIKQTTKRKLDREVDLLDEDMSTNERNFLEKAEKQPNRIIIHWFPLVGELKTNISHWTRIIHYERHGSTFSVSSGPDGSYENGFAVLPESGLYQIYAKLTFDCKNADKKQKRIEMEVGVHDYKGDSDNYIILSEVQHPTCARQGGLVTLFQEGLFRLTKGNRIFLRYKVPGSVMLASHDAFTKSYLGMHRVGAA